MSKYHPFLGEIELPYEDNMNIKEVKIENIYNYCEQYLHIPMCILNKQSISDIKNSFGYQSYILGLKLKKIEKSLKEIFFNKGGI